MSDEGAGQLGTIAGFTVFLSMLLLCVHLLVGLYATSVVTAAALDGARGVASARTDHADRAAVAEARRAAEEHVRDLLGRAGAAARFDWTGSTADEVVLHVTVPWPRLLPLAGGSLARAEVDRTVRLRVERRR